jgi:beta-glucosidase
MNLLRLAGRRKFFFQVGVFLFLLGALAACQGNGETVVTAVPPPPQSAAYLDPSLPPADRAADLLAQMTLAEKIGQMTLVEKNSIDPDDITGLALGALLSGGGGAPPVNDPASWLEMVNEYQEYALDTRLAVPLIYGVDAVHGHNNVKGAVLFPHNIGLGATRNPELLAEIGRVTAFETAATGIYWNYAPAVSIPQDIRWGRTYEGYSENTELVTTLSAAYLRGMQGEDLAAADTIIGTPKHFIGDGGTAWGSSTTGDYLIDQGDTQLSEAELRAVHLPPYIAAIEAGAQSIMVSFSSWNGTKMHAQEYLITDVLKGELGFSGFVVSDWEAIDQIDRSYYTSVVTAINAGVDMNMVPYDYKRFINTLTEAVEKGDVSMERIDDAVRRILTVKFAIGLFERPQAGPEMLDLIGADAHRELARQAVRESLVLLHHDGATLPLAADTPMIFLAGAAADDIGIQSGGWSIEWQGAAGNITPGTTIKDGLETAVSPDTQLQYNQFGKFDRITDENGDPLIADVGIVVVGERPYAEGIGDAAVLALPEADLTALNRLRERSDKLIVIVLSGRPVLLDAVLPAADAVIAAWLPGTEGAGITDLLFGEYEFSGRLAYTWPRDMGQIPFDFANLPQTGCAAPLYPFGHGLTTTDPAPDLPDCP